jgi:hypothetical protein
VHLQNIIGHWEIFVSTLFQNLSRTNQLRQIDLNMLQPLKYIADCGQIEDNENQFVSIRQQDTQNSYPETGNPVSGKEGSECKSPVLAPRVV